MRLATSPLRRRSPRRSAAWTFVACALLLAACGTGSRASDRSAGSASSVSPSVSARQPVTVFAAASLTQSFTRLAAAFEAADPAWKVRPNFAGSQALVTQITQGAPVDVVATADVASLQPLTANGTLDPARVAVFASNRLTIVVAAQNPLQIKDLADLTTPGRRIVLAAPQVPAGRYAREAFARAGVTPPAGASSEPDVKAVLNKVALGEADAGVVYVTDVAAAGSKVTAVPLAAAVDVTATYPIAPLSSARQPKGAAAFVDFVRSDAGQRILRAEGFGPPP